MNKVLKQPASLFTCTSFVFHFIIFMFILHLLKLIKQKCPEVFRMQCTQYAFTIASHNSFHCADTNAFYSTIWVVYQWVIGCYAICVDGYYLAAILRVEDITNVCTPPTPTDISWLLEEKRAYSQIAALWQTASQCSSVLQYRHSEIRRELLLLSIFSPLFLTVCELWTTIRSIMYLAIYFLAAQCNVSLNQDLFGAFTV
jgi:hypothetical protein